MVTKTKGLCSNPFVLDLLSSSFVHDLSSRYCPCFDYTIHDLLDSVCTISPTQLTPVNFTHSPYILIYQIFNTISQCFSKILLVECVIGFH